MNAVFRGAISLPAVISLRHLTLNSSAGPSLPSLESLCRSGANLCSLTLSATIPHARLAPLLFVAPQLKALKFLSLPVASSSHLDFFADSLLPACTSLVVFGCRRWKSTTLVRLLDACKVKLQVLEIESPGSVGGWEEVSRALTLPAMTELKRCRLKGWDITEIDPLSEVAAARAQWVARCEERGIEVRGNERYFTGELLFSFLVSSQADPPCAD